MVINWTRIKKIEKWNIAKCKCVWTTQVQEKRRAPTKHPTSSDGSTLAADGTAIGCARHLPWCIIMYTELGHDQNYYLSLISNLLSNYYVHSAFNKEN